MKVIKITIKNIIRYLCVNFLFDKKYYFLFNFIKEEHKMPVKKAKKAVKKAVKKVAKKKVAKKVVKKKAAKKTVKKKAKK